jgi:disulfide bond formation protein DsbB
MFKNIKSYLLKNSLYISWSVALISFLGSVYYAEILNIPRCVLCWSQDIFMYPLVLIIAVGIMRKDKSVSSYVLPLSVIGGAIALYQNFLIWGVLSESLAPCVVGVSCVTQQPFLIFPFLTLALLALIAFSLITGLMLMHRSAHSND